MEILDGYLMHGPDSETEHFINEMEYSNEKLHEILNEIL